MARRKIEGSRLLVTGASQGIGKALAEEAARAGARVLAVARSEDLLQETVQGIRAQGGTVVPVVADVTDPEGRRRMVDAAQEHFGGLDVLINNAGIGATGHFCDADEDRLRKIMEVNFFGLTETTRVFLPMLKQGVTPAIVNISSVAGKRGIPARSEYSASKFAVQGFTEALRGEMVRFGIDVILVNPGLTATNFSKNMLEQKARIKYDHKRGMTSLQVAQAALKALAKGSREVNLTFEAKLIIFMNRFFPGLVDKIAMKKVREAFKDELAPAQR